MNLASILVLCIVAGLLILAMVRSRKSGPGDCGGNCAECAFRCSHRKGSRGN